MKVQLASLFLALSLLLWGLSASAQTVQVSGLCITGTLTLNNNGTLDGKVWYYVNGPVLGFPNVDVDLYWSAADSKWFLAFDGQPYFQNSDNTTLPPSTNIATWTPTVDNVDCLTGNPLSISGSGTGDREINVKQNITNIDDNGSFNYGSINVGTPDAKTFTIENTGTITLNLTGTPPNYVVKGGSNPGDFAITQPSTGSISASSSTTFVVTFTPGGPGARSCTISIANNDGNENPYDITLNGMGVCPAITFTATPTNTCPGGSTGQIAVSGVTGGTGPYTYSKDNGVSYQGGATFTGLAANTYQIVVKDANGCTSGASPTVVGSFTAPTCNITGPTTACPNSTGNVYNGTAGMSAYSWGISGSGTIDGSTTGSSISVTAGASGSYTVSVTITNANGCTATCSSAAVSINACSLDFTGTIVWEKDDATGVKDATVNLTGSGSGSDATDVNGDYAITLGPGSGNYTLKPVKNINKFNGVTVGDATAIQQHLTGNAPITDLYRQVCADVNKSNSITSLDASLLNQALLGNPTANNLFNTSWRFVPASHTMASPPWGFPEQIDFVGVSSVPPGQDFIGMKIGDVTGDANPANLTDVAPMTLHAANQNLVTGEQVSVTFTAGKADNIAAFQFGLQFDPQVLELTEVEPLTALPLSSDNFGTYNAAEGEFRAAWSQAEGVNVEEMALLFRLHFTVVDAASGLTLSDVLTLDPDVLPALVYTEALDEMAVELTYGQVSATGDLHAAPAIRLQNRPNPFTGSTVVGFTLPEACEAQLRVYDLSGRELLRIDRAFPAGYSEETVFTGAATGVLVCEMVTPYGVATRKMTAGGE